ncbi:uncharacterized protein LOC143132844 [Alosa pseudoharengus]|uniref:uncharacterized protein LOC143132844 n=1 Tax=Alosa pseudoharengus TaxID=34774 RepID=UPI003F8AC94A
MRLLLLMIAFSCALDRSSAADLHPAEIFARESKVVEGDSLELRCIFHTKLRGELHMYLCKNGVGIRMEILLNTQETTFKIPDVKKEDSGNYSCVYSEVKHAANTLTAVGTNSIFIQVKDFMVAPIFVNTLHVVEGTNIDVKCSHFKTKTQKIVHVYLCKNGIGVSMEVAQAEEAIFTLRKVRREDSGNYSCVYSIKKHLPGNVTLTSFNNSVIIQVTESKQDKSSQNTPFLTWIIWITIPVILLCVLGAVSCFYRRRLLPNAKRRTEAAQETEVIYSEAQLVQRNSEPERYMSVRGICETQQTEEVYSKPTRSKAKKKSKSHSRQTEAAQEPEVIYSDPRLVQSYSEPEPCNSEMQHTDTVYSKLTRTGVTRETQQTDMIYSETTHSRSKRKPKSSSPAEMKYASVQYKKKKKQHELSPPEDSVFGEFV